MVTLIPYLRTPADMGSKTDLMKREDRRKLLCNSELLSNSIVDNVTAPALNLLSAAYPPIGGHLASSRHGETQTTLFNTPEKIPNIREVHPYIISVSRATDITAFYMDWFFDRFKQGYILWRSPYNQAFTQKVWFDNVHAAIFWTKDPQALYQSIQKLNTCPFLYYAQITLNDYEPELEPGVPPLHDRINAFQKISQNLGSHRIMELCKNNMQ